jgi:hypothetical protein
MGGSFGAPSAAAPSSRPTAALDPLDFLGGGAAAAPVASALDAASPALAQRLAALNLSSRSTEQVLAADANVRISVVRGRNDTGTALTVLLTRLGGAPIRSSALHVPWPATVQQKAVEVIPAAAAGAAAPAGMISLPALDAQVTTAVVCQVVLSAARLPAPGSLVVTLGYVDPATGSRQALKATVDFALADVMRPAPITTAQFGGGWKQLAQEIKFQVRLVSLGCRPRVTLPLSCW